MTWIEFFQETGSVIHDAPVHFSVKEMSIEKVIVTLVPTQKLKLLKMEKEKDEKDEKDERKH